MSCLPRLRYFIGMISPAMRICIKSLRELDAKHGNRQSELLICGGADVNAGDGRFRATPAGWAIAGGAVVGLSLAHNDVLVRDRRHCNSGRWVTKS